MLLGREDDPDALHTSTKILSDLVHEVIRSVCRADDFYSQVRHHIPGFRTWPTLLWLPAVVQHKGHIWAPLALYCGAKIEQHLLHSATQVVLSSKASEHFRERRSQPHFIRTHRG